MKKPTKQGDVTLMTHHLLEAMEDEMTKELEALGVHGFDEAVDIVKNNNPTDDRQAKTIAAYMPVVMIHKALHDLIEHGTIKKIQDSGLRRLVERYDSPVRAGLTKEQQEEYDKGLGL